MGECCFLFPLLSFPFPLYPAFHSILSACLSVSNTLVLFSLEIVFPTVPITLEIDYFISTARVCFSRVNTVSLPSAVFPLILRLISNRQSSREIPSQPAVLLIDFPFPLTLPFPLLSLFFLPRLLLSFLFFLLVFLSCF